MHKKRIFNQNAITVTYQQALEEYLTKLELQNASPYTVKSYKQMNLTFLHFIGSDYSISKIDYKSLQAFVEKYRYKLSPNSIRAYIRHINVILNYAMEQGYITTKPKMPTVIPQEPNRKVYSQEDIDKLLKTDPNETFMQTQCRTIIATFLCTGLRLSELTSLLIKDVDLESGIIYSRHTKSRKARILPIPKKLITLLTKWLSIRNNNNEEDSLFCNSYGEQLPQNTLRTLIYRYNKSRGVSDTSIHQFRRTFITNAVNNGADIIQLSRITGHSNLKVLNMYYVSDVEQIKKLGEDVCILNDKKRTRLKK